MKSKMDDERPHLNHTRFLYYAVTILATYRKVWSKKTHCTDPKLVNWQGNDNNDTQKKTVNKIRSRRIDKNKPKRKS